MKNLVKNICLIIGLMMACNIGNVRADSPKFNLCKYVDVYEQDSLTVYCSIITNSEPRCQERFNGGELKSQPMAPFEFPLNVIFNEPDIPLYQRNIPNYVNRKGKCPAYLVRRHEESKNTVLGVEIPAFKGTIFGTKIPAYTYYRIFEDLDAAQRYADLELDHIVQLVLDDTETGDIIGDEHEEIKCVILGPHVTPKVKWIIDLIQISIPIIIIIMTIVDFTGIVLSGEDKNFKAAGSKLVKRLVIGAAIILLPMLIAFIIDLSGVLVPYGIAQDQLFCSLF